MHSPARTTRHGHKPTDRFLVKAGRDVQTLSRLSCQGTVRFYISPPLAPVCKVLQGQVAATSVRNSGCGLLLRSELQLKFRAIRAPIDMGGSEAGIGSDDTCRATEILRPHWLVARRTSGRPVNGLRWRLCLWAMGNHRHVTAESLFDSAKDHGRLGLTGHRLQHPARFLRGRCVAGNHGRRVKKLF